MELSAAELAAIIAGTSSGSRISGPIRSRAVEFVAIGEISAPVVASAPLSSSTTGTSGSRPAPSSRKNSQKTGIATNSNATR